MDGPSHYREAERLLGPVPSELSEEAQYALVPLLLARAQVHATLALVAATAKRGPGQDSWALAIRESG